MTYEDISNSNGSSSDDDIVTSRSLTSNDDTDDETPWQKRKIDKLTRELVILTRARRALLQRSRRCLALMAPRRRQLAALLRREQQYCHAINGVGSVCVVKRKPHMQAPLYDNFRQHSGRIPFAAVDENAGDDDVIMGHDKEAFQTDSHTVSVLPFDDDHATLNCALDRAIDANVGSNIWID
jgi:hypothetical protein